MKRLTLSRDRAEEIALRAVTYLASDEDRLARFLTATGASPEGLRADLAEPGFLACVLDHVMGDDATLLAFCEAKLANRPPPIWPTGPMSCST